MSAQKIETNNLIPKNIPTLNFLTTTSNEIHKINLQISNSYSFKKPKLTEKSKNETTHQPQNSLVKKLNNLSKLIQMKTMSQIRSNKTSINSKMSNPISIFDNSNDDSIQQDPDFKENISLNKKDFLSPDYSPINPDLKFKHNVIFHVKSENNKLSQYKFNFTLPTNVEISKIKVDSKLTFFKTDFDKLIQQLRDFCSEINNEENPCINFETFRNIFNSTHGKENYHETFEEELKESLTFKNKEILSFANLNSRKSIFHQNKKDLENEKTSNLSDFSNNLKKIQSITRKTNLTLEGKKMKTYFTCNCYYSKYFLKSKSKFIHIY
jgi:hypothetical protein